MSFFDGLRSFFTKEDSSAYEVFPTAFGLRFASSQHTICKKGTAPARVQLQFITLQMLWEAGEAESLKDGFFLPDSVATRLQPEERNILSLPEPWPGSFALDIKGVSSSSAFSLCLSLCEPGGESVPRYRLEGPLMIVGDNERYLPDIWQYLALKSVYDHQQLTEKTEGANISAVYALQQAQEHGVPISLRHFDKERIEKPTKVGVSIVENADGSLRLIPDFGVSSLSPQCIEERLGQLEGSNKVAMRAGHRIILLDEEKLAGVHEILECRIISARDKEQFFKTPTAFLNAALVDLDTGLSIRVHGTDVFKKAYFGEDDRQSLSWFGERDYDAKLFSLSDELPFIQTLEDVDALSEAALQAIRKNETHLIFADNSIVLPDSEGAVFTQLLAMRAKIAGDLLSGEEPYPSGGEGTGTTQLTVAIDLHDEALPEGLQGSLPSVPLFRRDIGRDFLRYSLFDYQEEGVRWIAGMLERAVAQQDGTCSGALLADDMGLGKTCMALASLRLYLAMARNCKKQKPVLAVMPLILLENWQQEVDKVFYENPFTDIVALQKDADLKRFLRTGGRRESTLAAGEIPPPQHEWRYSLKVGSIFGSERLDLPGRLVLTNYDTLRDYQFSLCMVDWGVVIFDEAQEIKNPNAMKTRAAKGLKADFRLAVTGTPVENSLNDFWCLFDTVCPGLLGSFKAFQNTYISPITRAPEENKALARIEVGQSLRAAVGPLMLRRTKEEKLRGLPTKTIHDGLHESQYQREMSGIQLEQYDTVISTVVEVKRSGNAQKIRQILLPSLRHLQDISLHPGLLDGGLSSLFDSADDFMRIASASAKLKIVLSILDEMKKRNEKGIIFVVNKNLQRFLAQGLPLLYGVPVSVVNGDTTSVASLSGRGKESRIQLIRSFESRPGFGIICMSPLAAGVGLTVTGANNVIHLERHWNPAKEAQATDRVYRIGAQKEVHVYIPLVTHPVLKSFDVNLHELLQRKLDLKDAVICPSEVSPEAFDSRGLFGEEDSLSPAE